MFLLNILTALVPVKNIQKLKKDFFLQVQEHGVDNCTIKREQGQDEGDEGDAAIRGGSYEVQDRHEE